MSSTARGGSNRPTGSITVGRSREDRNGSSSTVRPRKRNRHSITRNSQRRLPRRRRVRRPPRNFRSQRSHLSMTGRPSSSPSAERRVDPAARAREGQPTSPPGGARSTPIPADSNRDAAVGVVAAAAGAWPVRCGRRSTSTPWSRNPRRTKSSRRWSATTTSRSVSRASGNSRCSAPTVPRVVTSIPTRSCGRLTRERLPSTR